MFRSQMLPIITALFAAMASGSPVTTRDVATTPKDFTGEIGCQSLKRAAGSKVFLPGDAEYVTEAADFWSNTELMSPTCIFRPTKACDVATAINGNRKTGTQWAIRGGGHMGIRGSNNIDKGMLIVMSGIKTLKISEDRKTVDVGPGNTWGDVYSYLAQFNVSAAGGRLAPVGVPGLLIGGGISFYGNQAGWAADNVLEYQVVLASNGSTVTASATENQDLFWALKGGSANYGVVTNFKLRTFPSRQVFAGVYTVSGEHMAEFEEAVATYASNPQDPLSHIVPMVIPSAGGASVASVVLFYDSETNSAPDCFKPFMAIPPLAPSTLAFKTVADFAVEVGGLVVPQINDMFIAGTTVGKTHEELLQGVHMTNQMFLDAIPELQTAIGGADKLVLTSINWQPLGAAWQDASARMNPVGNPLGLDVAGKGTYLAWALAVEWVDGEGHDAIVDAWVRKTIAAMEAATKAAGIYDAFNYMGDAAGFQEIYAGYGADNENKLREISRKYDPERATQLLWPGGFKIGV